MKDNLEKIAGDVRQGIKNLIAESDYVNCVLRDFPSGSCELASVMTGLALKNLGMSNVLQVVGNRQIPNSSNTQNHVWLTVDDKYIVDITADQFDDCDIPVVVIEKSDFHNTFSIKETRPVDTTYLQDDENEDFYSMVLSKIERD